MEGIINFYNKYGKATNVISVELVSIHMKKKTIGTLYASKKRLD